MTDKEQKKWHEEKWGTNEEPEETPTERPHCDNDSLKNQDKEQIIIDTNKYFMEIVNEGRSTIGYRVLFPERLLTEIMKQNKQLALKTQECESLKEKYEELKEDRYNLNIEMYVCDRYRKALEEIEKQCKCYGRSKYTQEFDREYGGELDTNILDIITKAKDGNNDR